MMHIALKTEYSFRKCFLPIKEIHKYVNNGVVGIADINSTFGHVPLMKEAKKHGFKPIYGVRLTVMPDDANFRTSNSHWVFIAKNIDGLQEIYELTTTAFDNFHYIPRLLLSDISGISNNVVVIPTCDFGDWNSIAHLATAVPFGPGSDMGHIDSNFQRVYIDNNDYGDIDDKDIYELIAGTRPGEDRPMFQFATSISEQHILPDNCISGLYNLDSGCDVTDRIAGECEVDFPIAPTLAYPRDQDIRQVCARGVMRNNLVMTPEYTARLEYEIGLIEEKGFTDYFLIVSDMIMEAKRKMLVGPCRGSSAGSLVCYLMGITEIDPIKYDLIFERFIDINRFDTPDIDIDFPDTKRDSVIDYLKKQYGNKNVTQISNVNRYKPKSLINDFAKGLFIPKARLEEFKDSIIEKTGGDARVSTVMDEFQSDTGKEFLLDYPQIALCARAEGHATHVGKHAAGVIVSGDALSKYGTVNPKEGSIMMDKRDAEAINLLKIDCLGLRTLSILEECCDQVGMKYDDLYSLPLDDAETYKIFRQLRLQGIFQFEGQALVMLCRDLNVTKFDDLVAITALARPGALRSGGAAIYTACANGRSDAKYFGDLHKNITIDTYGVMVYQEQMMRIAREIAGFSWMVVSDMRKAASKSMGDDYFKKFEEDFINGCINNSGLDLTAATALWKDVSHSGSWIFNKSHAVAYAIISYWTAYFKAHHPLEFAIANLNNVSDDDSALRMLRDLVQKEGLKYLPVDPDTSGVKWTIQDGVMVGGLTNIDGVAAKTAEKIILARKGKAKLTPSIYKKLMNPVTPFDILFPTEHYWGRLLNDPKSFDLDRGFTRLNEIDGEGEYLVIGKLKKRNLMDNNEYNKVLKRGHEVEEDKRWYLNIIIEDDTDSIMCHIDRNSFSRLNGRYIAEHGKIDEDWYMIKGTMKGSWRGLNVLEILNLKEHFGGYLL